MKPIIHLPAENRQTICTIWPQVVAGETRAIDRFIHAIDPWRKLVIDSLCQEGSQYECVTHDTKEDADIHALASSFEGVQNR
jgi:hypothetical protein